MKAFSSIQTEGLSGTGDALHDTISDGPSVTGISKYFIDVPPEESEMKSHHPYYLPLVLRAILNRKTKNPQCFLKINPQLKAK